MLDFTGVRNYYIRCGYTDMRKQIDGLAALVRLEYSLELNEESLFLFCGRKADRIKALYWDGTGHVLLTKRLAEKRFQWPRNQEEHGGAVHRTDKGLQAGESGERLLKTGAPPNCVNYLETGYPPLHALRIITFISSRIASLSLQQNIRKRTKVRVQQRHSPCSRSTYERVSIMRRSENLAWERFCSRLVSARRWDM